MHCQHLWKPEVSNGELYKMSRDSPTCTGITTSLLTQFSLFEQYAGAAYCKDNNDDSTGAITCAGGNCPSVQQAGAKSILEFQK